MEAFFEKVKKKNLYTASVSIDCTAPCPPQSQPALAPAHLPPAPALLPPAPAPALLSPALLSRAPPPTSKKKHWGRAEEWSAAVPVEAKGHVIGRGGANIKGLRAIPGIESVKLSGGKELNASHMLVARGTLEALQIVRENINTHLGTAAQTISNQSRQHHTRDLVSGRLLTPTDVHSELSKAKQKHKPGSTSEKRARDKGRKGKEAAREARLVEERGGGPQPRAWGRMEQAEHSIQARQLEASCMYSASLLGEPLADDVFVNHQVCKRLEWKGATNY